MRGYIVTKTPGGEGERERGRRGEKSRWKRDCVGIGCRGVRGGRGEQQSAGLIKQKV